MKLIQATESHLVFQGVFGSSPVRYILDRTSEEIFIHSDDLAKALGYANEHEMLSSDAILDILNDIKKIDGTFPIVKIDINEKGPETTCSGQ